MRTAASIAVPAANADPQADVQGTHNQHGPVQAIGIGDSRDSNYLIRWRGCFKPRESLTRAGVTGR